MLSLEGVIIRRRENVVVEGQRNLIVDERNKEKVITDN